MIPAGSLGIGEGLADDVLKVRVHVDMRAQAAAKEKPRRSEASRLGLDNINAGILPPIRAPCRVPL